MRTISLIALALTLGACSKQAVVQPTATATAAVSPESESARIDVEAPCPGDEEAVVDRPDVARPDVEERQPVEVEGCPEIQGPTEPLIGADGPL